MSRGKGIHKIEAHVAGICLKEDEEKRFNILIGKRSAHRQLFPNYWECGGGQVHVGEDFETAVKNQIKGEFGVDIIVKYPVGVYNIKTNEGVIPGIRFICKLKDDTQKIDLNPEELVEYKWIDENEINSYMFIPGLKEDIKKALKLYRKILGQSK